MKRIGLLSDTHGYWDARYETYFEPCDEIWHAGDIGTMELADRFAEFKKFRAVYGNIDGGDLLRVYPKILRFKCEEADVLMKHIGGYPGNYHWSIAEKLRSNPPDLFISGHSHILKVMYDKELNMLHINPGAAGLQGFQTKRTLVRFVVDGKQFKDIEIIELG